MARWKAGSRGSATSTAKVLSAAGADLHNAGEGLWQASLAMQKGDYERAETLAKGTISLLKMVVTVVEKVK